MQHDHSTPAIEHVRIAMLQAADITREPQSQHSVGLLHQLGQFMDMAREFLRHPTFEKYCGLADMGASAEILGATDGFPLIFQSYDVETEACPPECPVPVSQSWAA